MAEPETPTRPAEAALRSPDHVMRLSRMGASFPTRLSFTRSLIRQLAREGASVTRPVWEMNDQGYGRAVYAVDLSGHTYSLIAFSNALDPSQRTDRVIAEAWDTGFALFDGVPEKDDLDRLQQNVPRQEAGRCSQRELVLSRANKSVRLFQHVVERLSEGRQPDVAMVDQIGYLMRTTAVYGNGKFGIADRGDIRDRPGMAHPFRAEMLTVWLIREFTHDLAEHVARCRAPERAVGLSDPIKRHLGIGNSTGLGMAPFLVNHPILLNNWMLVRETALARVLAVAGADDATQNAFVTLLARARNHLEDWNVADERQQARIVMLRSEATELGAVIGAGALRNAKPWARLMATAADWSEEAQEFLVALMLEVHGDLIDGLTDCMSAPPVPGLNAAMKLSELQALLEKHYGWALAVDFEQEGAKAQFWYTSEDKAEPRLGLRDEEDGADKEHPLDIARQVQSLSRAIVDAGPDQSVAEFLLARPDQRLMVQRAQAAPSHPYMEIRDNLIGRDCLPIDMLRCKLAFFGATRFDPRSDRWTRITLFQGAPTRHDLSDIDWSFPVMGA